jgi:hypothetical protein
MDRLRTLELIGTDGRAVVMETAGAARAIETIEPEKLGGTNGRAVAASMLSASAGTAENRPTITIAYRTIILIPRTNPRDSRLKRAVRAGHRNKIDVSTN